jgi:hypothetical protein
MPPMTDSATRSPPSAPMAEVLPLCDDRLGNYPEAVEAYLVAAGIGVSS